MNINQMLKQAKAMQQKMQEAQEEIHKKEFEGKAGGGVVSLVLDGKGELKKISINPSLLIASEKEVLEDLIVAAHNDAKHKQQEASENSMSGMLNGFPMPPGMKLPF